MEGIDLTTFAGVAVVAWLLVAMVATLFDKAKPYQKLLALVFAVALGILAKLQGVGFVDSTWLELLIQSALAAFNAGLGHDKLAKPLGELLGELLNRPPPVSRGIGINLRQ